tara:strand:+ start:4088 stop:5656 length:1569 start_codon:yes stop_codon:yes gene_type:complete
MSAETLKFFEAKDTEEIINWMLSNLSEDQIRSCLDQSGIPDTSVIKGKEPIAAAAAGSGPIQTVTLPDGTQKQLQPGEGSSSDPFPSGAVRPAPERPKRDTGKIFLDKYRKKCNGTGYLLKSVSKDGVEYYEFKEIEDDDTAVTPGANVGDVGWVKKNVPISQFKDFCTDEDREIFEFLKEENMETFLGAPAEVVEVAADYPSSGLVSPLPIIAPQVDIVPEPTPVTAALDEVQITEPMLKALKIQQGSSQVMSTSYPNLYSRGLTMYPIFVYASEGDLVLHLTTVVIDGRLSFTKDSTNKKLLNSKFKKITTAIQSAVEAGLYTPTDNIQEELNEALKSISQDITIRISKIYDPIRLENYTYFGTLDDEQEWIDPSLPESSESFDMIKSQDLLEDQSDPVENFNLLDIDTAEASPVNPSNVVPSVPKSKKISDMTIPEIEERMRIKHGEQYVRDYKPEKYVNSLNVTNVRYVKRPKCPYEDEPVMVSRPIFSEFQGKPSVNSGPGRFGETDSDSEDDLLFN